MWPVINLIPLIGWNYSIQYKVKIIWIRIQNQFALIVTWSK